MNDPFSNVRFRSLLYWMHLVETSNNKALSYYWHSRKAALFNENYPACPICTDFNNTPIWRTTENMKFDNMDLGGVVECYHVILRGLSNQQATIYESNFDVEMGLKDIVPIDVPKGAARITKANLEILKDYKRSPARWLTMTGGTGTAKTHVLFKLRAFYGDLAFYITSSDFNETLLKATKENTVDHFIDYVTNVPILMLDDYGMEHKSASEYTLNIITHIVDQRYTQKRFAPVWVSSNLTADELIVHPSMNVRRMASRICDSEIGNLIHFTQADFRLLSTKKAAGMA